LRRDFLKDYLRFLEALRFLATFFLAFFLAAILCTPFPFFEVIPALAREPRSAAGNKFFLLARKEKTYKEIFTRQALL